MSKKLVFLLLFLVILTFGNSLRNHFVGDDEILFLNNTYYQHLQNVKDLFTRHYFPAAGEGAPKNYYSGSEAYRPVLSATYFLDYFLWQKKPFGYHLTNLLLHAFNVLLVFYLFYFFFKKQSVAFFSAALFAVHPVEAEAVCNIGYRADLLSCVFVLSALLFFLRAETSAAGRRWQKPVSFLAYFLAVFTKESALVLPLLLVVYDFYFPQRRRKEIFAGWKKRYGGYILISLFYVFIYVFVFPNRTFTHLYFMGGSLPRHVATMFWIFARYLSDLTFPWTVTMLPPLYSPSIGPAGVSGILGGLVFVLFWGLIPRTFSKHKAISFFLLWFGLSWLPVSNLIPLVNSMAHRFLYFPSIGMMAVYGLLVEQACSKVPGKYVQSLDKIIKIAILGLCMAITVPLNTLWKDTLTVGRTLQRLYPDQPKVYSILGLTYARKSDFARAKQALEKAVALGSRDRRDYYELGLLLLNEPTKAEAFFRQYGQYGSPYNVLGRRYFLQGDAAAAERYLEQGMAVRPTYAACGYLIQIYAASHQDAKASAILSKANSYVFSPAQQAALRRLLAPPSGASRRIDFGI